MVPIFRGPKNGPSLIFGYRLILWQTPPSPPPRKGDPRRHRPETTSGSPSVTLSPGTDTSQDSVGNPVSVVKGKEFGWVRDGGGVTLGILGRKYFWKVPITRCFVTGRSIHVMLDLNVTSCGHSIGFELSRYWVFRTGGTPSLGGPTRVYSDFYPSWRGGTYKRRYLILRWNQRHQRCPRPQTIVEHRKWVFKGSGSRIRWS